MIGRTIGGFVLAVLSFVAGWVLLGLFQTPPGAESRDDPRLVASLRHLDAEVDRAEPQRMQTLFPEGYVFTRVLHGLAWAALAADSTLDPALRAEALAGARAAQGDLASPRARASFQRGLNPPYGAFFVGWTLWLDAELLRADSSALSAFRQRGDRLADALARALDSTGSPFLPSYRRYAWPADGLVGVAALAQHDRLFEPRYTDVLRRWREAAGERLDPELDLFAHAARLPDGAPLGGVRGSSQALMLRFMAEIDPALGREMYATFREHFVTTRFGLSVVTEYPAGTTGEPDIDSGPLPLGVSLPGTVVAIGAAQSFGDEALARDLSQTVEAFGAPVEWRGQRMYAFGALPVGDAFLAWARTASAPASAPRRERLSGQAHATPTCHPERM